MVFAQFVFALRKKIQIMTREMNSMQESEYNELIKDISDDLRERMCKQQNKHLVQGPTADNVCMLETFCTLCGVKLVMDENGDYIAKDNGIIDLERSCKREA